METFNRCAPRLNPFLPTFVYTNVIMQGLDVAMGVEAQLREYLLVAHTNKNHSPSTTAIRDASAV